MSPGVFGRRGGDPHTDVPASQIVDRADRFDAPVRVFAAAIALLMALVVTLVPRPFVDSSAAALRAGGRVAGRSGRRPRQILVAGELSLAVALSAAGALLGLSLMRLFAVDPGFDPSAVAVVRVSAYATRRRYVCSYVGTTHTDPGQALQWSSV